jgi:hypothetical protein
MSDPATQVPGFLIVGTPRSGTTLVQRLVSELPGVRVPPETKFLQRLHRFRWRFPLEGPELRDALRACSMSAGVSSPDLGRMIDRLGGRATGPLGIWEAVLRESAGDGATLYGEKTPLHLRWWRPLSVALPSLRIIAVVRDPRGVVSSWLEVPFGPRGENRVVRMAQTWKQDQHEVVRATNRLGSARCLVIRYENAVMDPAAARRRIAEFLGINFGAHDPIRSVTADELFLSWEVWKDRAVGEITRERIDAWRESLDPSQVRIVEAICRRGMTRFGYPVSTPLVRSWVVKLGLGPKATVPLRAQIRRLNRRRLERTPLF